MPKAVIVVSSDESYFPLARGLVMSLLQSDPASYGAEIAFLDNGCSPQSLEWLSQQGVTVRAIDPELLGDLAHTSGYLRSTVSRPLLPTMFLSADAIVWMDADTWVQTRDVVGNLVRWARARPDKIFMCPEWHYSYEAMNGDPVSQQIENLGFYYAATYGPQVAAELSARPLYNSGVFAMSRGHPLWPAWWDEVRRLYSRDYGPDTPRVHHMAEQSALNVLAHRMECAIPVDPLYNYLCQWGTPFRDERGTVRVAYPPAPVIGVVHLSLWRQRKRFYLDHGLLYQAGAYLTDHERGLLLS